jgi:hypothetical protein
MNAAPWGIKSHCKCSTLLVCFNLIVIIFNHCFYFLPILLLLYGRKKSLCLMTKTLHGWQIKQAKCVARLLLMGWSSAKEDTETVKFLDLVIPTFCRLQEYTTIENVLSRCTLKSWDFFNGFFFFFLSLRDHVISERVIWEQMSKITRNPCMCIYQTQNGGSGNHLSQ